MEMLKNRKYEFNHSMDDSGNLFDLVGFTTPILIQMVTVYLLMRFYVGMYKKKYVYLGYSNVIFLSK